MSNFRPYTRAVIVTFLGSLIQLCCGEGGTLQTNITGICTECLQRLGHTGFVPAHGLCAFPVYTVQALGCSAGNSLRQALGCMHFPGLSYSGSGSRYSTKAQTWLGLCFVPFPDLSSSGDRVLGKRSRPQLKACLIASSISAAQFSGCTTDAPSQVQCVSLLGS